MKNLKRYYIVAITLSVFLGSCEKENVADQVAIEESNEQEVEIESPDLEGKTAYVLTTDGRQITEEEYLKELNSQSNSRAKSSETYSRPVTADDLNKLGMTFSNNRTVRERYKRNQAWLNYDNVDVYGLLAACRPFGNSGTCSNGYNGIARWETTRTTVGGMFQRNVGFPQLQTSPIYDGRPDRDIHLNRIKAYEYEVSDAKSITNTYKVGSKIGIKLSANFFLGTIGSEFSAEINLESSQATATEQKESHKLPYYFTEGNIVPQGQRCTFQVWTQDMQTVQKYDVTVRVKGRAYVKYTAKGVHHVRDEADGAKYAFPDKERKGMVYKYEVTSNYKKIWTVRTNCQPL